MTAVEYDPDVLATYYVKTPGGCWRWWGKPDKAGYGRKKHHDKSWGAHRFVFEVMTGIELGELHIDHLCRNRRCVNPLHLDPVTPSVNTYRVWTRYVEPFAPHLPRFCKNKHEFTPENTRMYRGRRCCRACERMWSRAHAAAALVREGGDR